MQESLAFAPTHQIHVGQSEHATETLQRGRGLLSPEMRGLRTSLNQLRAILWQRTLVLSIGNLRH